MSSVVFVPMTIVAFYIMAQPWVSLSWIRPLDQLQVYWPAVPFMIIACWLGVAQTMPAIGDRLALENDLMLQVIYRGAIGLIAALGIALGIALIMGIKVDTGVWLGCWVSGIIVSGLTYGLALTLEIDLVGRLAALMTRSLGGGFMAALVLLGISALDGASYGVLIFALGGWVIVILILLVAWWTTFMLPDKLARRMAERYSQS